MWIGLRGVGGLKNVEGLMSFIRFKESVDWLRNIEELGICRG